MSKSKQNPNGRYKPKRSGKSVFDGNPTLIVNRYWLPRPYVDPVHDVLTAVKHDIPFNKAVDQVATLYKDNINRDKLAEHTLKYLANQY